MTRSRTTLTVAVLLSVALTMTACGKSHEGEDDDDAVTPTAPSTSSSTTTTPTTPTTPTPTPGATVAYVQDVKPILASDCVSCHAPGRASAGVDLSTYQSVMRVVVAGNTNSTLVLATKSGGVMNRYLSGDKAARAETIRQWVANGAPESR
jgi:hypothetical protein